MKSSEVIVVQQYDQKIGTSRNTFLVDPEALRATHEWIARNRPRMPAPQEIGMVMPYFVIYVTNEGDLNAPTTEVIDIYTEIDSEGTIAIPREETDTFAEILRKWGRDRLP